MNFRKWLISEMPIKKFELLGDWGPEAKKLYGYNKKDISILTSEKGVSKIHRKWSNSKNDFDFYFLRSPKGYKQREIGEVTPSWIEKNLEIKIEPNEDAITVIFTNNTGAEKIQMTAWTIAHRLGHAIRRDSIFQMFEKDINKDLTQILDKVYGIKPKRLDNLYFDGLDDEKKALASAVGTMKSARENNLVTVFEFNYELLAQYILNGKLRFNPLPKKLILRKRMVWGKPADQYAFSRLPEDHFDEWKNWLNEKAESYEYLLQDILDGLVGKIFVM